ncbi:MAG: trehalose-phosphatase, partial [Mycobacterium sp.]
MPKLGPVIIDPRRHDAVLFTLGTVVSAQSNAFDSTLTLVRQLREIGVGTAVFSSNNCRNAVTAAGIDDLFAVQVDGLVEAANRLAVRPGRCVVVADDAAVIEAGRAGGFALVIGVDRMERADALRGVGADTVVADLHDVTVRTGDQRMSQLPDASQALGEIAARRPAVFFDFDGTLSDIVNDPDAARPVAGATEALEKLAAQCPVAVLSGRDLADVTTRVGVPGIWYAGSHGFELT